MRVRRSPRKDGPAPRRLEDCGRPPGAVTGPRDDAVDHSAVMRRCLEGNEAAWAELVHAYSGLIFAIARRSGLPEDECEDTVQTVFATLARRLKDIGDRKHLTGWLITTTRRESWRTYRRMVMRRRTDELPREPVVTDADVERLERVAELLSALRRMGGTCERLIEALFLTDPAPSYRQIADRLRIPVGSIGPTRQRCLARLARMFGEILE